MPVPHTVYGCQFKCGFRHSASKHRIEKHEHYCWYNPANHTCKTCRFEEYYPDSSGESFCGGQVREPDWWVRECHQPDGGGQAYIDGIYNALFPDGWGGKDAYGVQIPPVEKCSFWEVKEQEPAP